MQWRALAVSLFAARLAVARSSGVSSFSRALKLLEVLEPQLLELSSESLLEPLLVEARFPELRRPRRPAERWAFFCLALRCFTVS